MPHAFLEPVPVAETDLAPCADVLALESRKAVSVTPWAVDTVEKYNECANRLDALAAKVRAHNKKSEKNKKEK